MADGSICNALGKSNKPGIFTYEICFTTYTKYNPAFIISSCFCNNDSFFGFTVAALGGYFRGSTVLVSGTSGRSKRRSGVTAARTTSVTESPFADA